MAVNEVGQTGKDDPAHDPLWQRLPEGSCNGKGGRGCLGLALLRREALFRHLAIAGGDAVNDEVWVIEKAKELGAAIAHHRL